MKKLLSVDELESQMAVELPDRELMALINVFIGAIVIPINIRDVNVALQVCGVLNNANFRCDFIG